MKYLKKKHLLTKHSNSSKIDLNKQGVFSIYFKEFGILKFNQFKAINFFLKKRLKFSDKIFFCDSNSLK